jgi:hypothetical protein
MTKTSSPSNPVEDFRPRLEAVFGRRYLDFLADVEVRTHTGKERSFTDAEPGKAVISFNEVDVRNVYVVTHEVAHAFHNHYFPILTEVVPAYRAEACAFLAECMLGSPESDAERRLQEARVIHWTANMPEVQALTMRAMRVGSDNSWRLKTAMEHILFGEFDGGDKRDHCEGNA